MPMNPSTSARFRAAPPEWLDMMAYPFRPHYFDTGEGSLHYLDEGSGPPVVLVHGTPTWSFLWRRLIPQLIVAGHRVIAPDHLGFGLSDKPRGAGYRPEDHARRLRSLLDSLELSDVTLVVHDFGGPIGLSWALDRPGCVSRLVILNSWLWSLDDDSTMAKGGRLASGLLGRFLYTRLNISPKFLIPAAFADRTRLSSATHRQYLAPFPDAASRRPLWELARALLGSSAWYDQLWRRHEWLRGKPALLAWGMRDPALGISYLERWKRALPGARIVEFPDAGHFVQEEAASELATQVTTFLRRSAPRAGGDVA